MRLVLPVQSHTPHPTHCVPGCMELPQALDPLQPQAQSLRAHSRLEVLPQKQDRGGSSNVFLPSPEVDVNVLSVTTGKGAVVAFTHAPYVCTCVVLQGSGTGSP